MAASATGTVAVPSRMTDEERLTSGSYSSMGNLQSHLQAAIPAFPFIPDMIALPRRPPKAPDICPAAYRMEIRAASSFLVYQELKRKSAPAEELQLVMRKLVDKESMCMYCTCAYGKREPPQIPRKNE